MIKNCELVKICEKFTIYNEVAVVVDVNCADSLVAKRCSFHHFRQCAVPVDAVNSYC